MSEGDKNKQPQDQSKQSEDSRETDSVASTAALDPAGHDATVSSNKSKPQANVESGKKSRRATAALLLSVLVAVTSALALFWLYSKQQPLIEQAQQQQRESQEQTQRVRDIERELGRVTQQLLNAQQKSLSFETQTREQLASYNKRLLSLSQTSREDWLLAEAEYLLRLANQRLLTEGQGQGILALLQAADNILHSIGDPSLYPVREALRADISILEQSQALDREGIYARLQVIQQLVMALPIAQLNAPIITLAQKPNTKMDTEDLSAAETLNGHWNNFKTQLLSLVRISHDNSEDLNLSPSLQRLAKAQAGAALAQAQAALLRDQAGVYKQALKQVTKVLQLHFIVSAQKLHVDKELQSLQAINLAYGKPDISTGLNRLRAYLENLHGISTFRKDNKTNSAGKNKIQESP